MAFPLDNHRSDVKMFTTLVEPRAAGECFHGKVGTEAQITYNKETIQPNNKAPQRTLLFGSCRKTKVFLAFRRHFNVKKSIDYGKLLYLFFFFYNKIDS